MGVFAGSYNVFIGDKAFSAAQVDALVSNGEVPNALSAVNPIAWSRLYSKGQGKIDLKSEVLNLGDDVRGTRKRIVIGEEDASVEIPIGDTSYAIMCEIFGINPEDKTSTTAHKPLKGSYDGVELTGRPLIVYTKQYGVGDAGKDDPKLGTGSDPEMFVFLNFIPDLERSWAFDPTAQRIPVLKGKPCSADGTTTEGHIGSYGTHSALS